MAVELIGGVVSEDQLNTVTEGVTEFFVVFLSARGKWLEWPAKFPSIKTAREWAERVREGGWWLADKKKTMRVTWR